MSAQTSTVVLLVFLLSACASGNYEVNVTRGDFPARLSGDLTIPKTQGKHPAIILAHGCNGLRSQTLDWVPIFVNAGYAVLALDSHSGRGDPSDCQNKPSRRLKFWHRADDLITAADQLYDHPRIDGERIAVIGFSEGAIGAIWARADPAPKKIRAYVAFYPWCIGALAFGLKEPLLFVLGDQDNWTPPSVCISDGEKMRQAGEPVSTLVLKGAGHSFDSSRLPSGGHFIPGARQGLGVTLYYNERAHEESKKAVLEFLRKHLQ